MGGCIPWQTDRPTKIFGRHFLTPPVKHCSGAGSAAPRSTKRWVGSTTSTFYTGGMFSWRTPKIQKQMCTLLFFTGLGSKVSCTRGDLHGRYKWVYSWMCQILGQFYRHLLEIAPMCVATQTWVEIARLLSHSRRPSESRTTHVKNRIVAHFQLIKELLNATLCIS